MPLLLLLFIWKWFFFRSADFYNDLKSNIGGNAIENNAAPIEELTNNKRLRDDAPLPAAKKMYCLKSLVINGENDVDFETTSMSTSTSTNSGGILFM